MSFSNWVLGLIAYSLTFSFLLYSLVVKVS